MKLKGQQGNLVCVQLVKHCIIPDSLVTNIRRQLMLSAIMQVCILKILYFDMPKQFNIKKLDVLIVFRKTSVYQRFYFDCVL